MPLETESSTFVIRSFLLDLEGSTLTISYKETKPDGTFIGAKVGVISGENFNAMVAKSPYLYATLKQAAYEELRIIENMALPSEVT